MMVSELAQFTKSLGFDVCRVAPCEAPRHAEAFREWLADGRAGEMAWLERNQERRTDPQLVLPGARSVIVLAMNYFQPDAAKNPSEAANHELLQASHESGSRLAKEKGSSLAVGENAAKGRIARYAWGDDYHDPIEKKLRALDDFLKERGGLQKCYVDTGPVLERDFAAQAGVGWHGKSTMLISRELGTWFFLAEILTTLDLPSLEMAVSEPEPDRCGSCTRCIAACPTGAITAPQKLDARRCISYLTIELKGSIPLEFRPLIGDRIYGCDDCLTACPWNRFAKASSESTFAAREFVEGWALRDFLKLDDEQFRTLFRKSPIKRTKRRGFLRNVCVALGNVGTRDDLPALEIALSDAEPLIVEHAAWAIAQIRKRFSAAEQVR